MFDFFIQAVKYSRDYKQKYDYFRSKLRRPVRHFYILQLNFYQYLCIYVSYNFIFYFYQPNLPNKTDIRVSRTNIMEDSYRAIMSIKKPDLLKTRYNSLYEVLNEQYQ